MSIDSMAKRLLPLVFAVLAAPALANEGGVQLQNSGANVSDQASLQRGAKLYFNYCSGCHSLQYMRYSRIAKDLGLTEAEVSSYLNFTGGAFGGMVTHSMPAGTGDASVGSEDWFGVTPPDLSLTGRVRGADWIHSYLLSFYPDPGRPSGWNNTVFPNSSMPNVLWERQGIQALHAAAAAEEHVAADADAEEEKAEGHGHGPAFDVVTTGTRSADEFRGDVRDVAAFLEYVGEPAALDREKYGIWVILFLLLFTGVAYLLKVEYWKDVH